MKRRDFLKGIGLTGLVPPIKRFSPDDEILPEIEDSGPEEVALHAEELSEWVISSMSYDDPLSSQASVVRWSVTVHDDWYP